MNEMRRVVHLNVTANWGTTGKIAEGIGVAARRRGNELLKSRYRRLHDKSRGA